MEIPKHPLSKQSCAVLTNEPYVAEGPASVAPVAHRDAGTNAFAKNASMSTARISELELSDAANSWLHAPVPTRASCYAPGSLAFASGTTLTSLDSINKKLEIESRVG